MTSLPDPEGPRVLAYSHDGYGLGHFRRNLRIATGLRSVRPDLQVLLATGASVADSFALPPGVECLKLPPVVKVADGRYVPEDPGLTYSDVMRARAGALLGAVRSFRPHLLLVDRYPRGLHGELDSALDAFHEHDPEAPAVLGLRDILDSPSRVREEWATQNHTEIIRQHYQAVLVYGDPDIFNPIEEYQLPPDIAGRIEFTGYLADDLRVRASEDIRAELEAERRLLVVCTVGGGKDAFPLAEQYLSAMELLEAQHWAGLMLTGPYMGASEVSILRGRGVTDRVPVVGMVTDVPSYLAAADVVVCMGGYNTMCEVLAVGAAAVVVPRSHPRLEQLLRVERLAGRGLVHLLGGNDLTPAGLAQAIRTAARTSRAQLRAQIAGVARNGVSATAVNLVARLPAGLNDRRPHESAPPRGGVELPNGVSK